MAGGMHPRGAYRGLPRSVLRLPESSPARHCWVLDPPGHPGRWPGLLAEWRREGPAWTGRVVYAVCVDGAVQLVEEWVPARALQPAAPLGGAAAARPESPG